MTCGYYGFFARVSSLLGTITRSAAIASYAPWGQKWPMTNLIENSPRQSNTIGGLIGAILTYFSQKNQISRVLLGDRPLGRF